MENDDFITSQVLENSQQWCAEIVEKLKEKIKKANEYSAQLDGLQKIMSNSNVIHKRKNLFKTILGFVSGVISWIITNLLSSAFLFDFSVTLPDQSQTISATKMNFLLFTNI